MSIFLMGVFNPHTKMWCTVAKCGNGHDDKTIDKLNRELKMKKISKVSLIPFFHFEDPVANTYEDHATDKSSTRINKHIT